MRYAVLLPLALAACAPASAATRGFPVGAFDRIESTGSADVRVTVGPAPSAEATGEQRSLDRLSVRVEGGVLKIGVLPGGGWNSDGWNSGGWNMSWGARKATIVHVTVPMLREATLTGSGDMDVDQVRTRGFAATLVGSGDLMVHAIDAQDVALTLRGSGDVRASGQARQARVVVSGSGDVDARGLRVADAFIQSSGSGDIALGATHMARVMLSGSGDVTVVGGARCDTVKHGSGDVRCH